MPASKKTMSKTRQLSALVNFVSCLRANRVKAKTRAFLRWRMNLEASRAAAAERLSSQILARAAAATARGHTRVTRRDRVKRRLRSGAADAVPQVAAGLLPAVADGCAAVVRRPPRPGLW